MLHLTMKMKRPFFSQYLFIWIKTGFFYEIFIAMFFKENSDQQLFDQIQISYRPCIVPFHIVHMSTGVEVE